MNTLTNSSIAEWRIIEATRPMVHDYSYGEKKLSVLLSTYLLNQGYQQDSYIYASVIAGYLELSMFIDNCENNADRKRAMSTLDKKQKEFFAENKMSSNKISNVMTHIGSLKKDQIVFFEKNGFAEIRNMVANRTGSTEEKIKIAEALSKCIYQSIIDIIHY